MSLPTASPSATTAPPPYRIGVDSYHRMIEAGIFGDQDRVELIDGELRTMPPISAHHAGKTNRLNRLFTRRVEDSALISVQNPLTLGKSSEPEPDLVLLKPRPDYYEGSNPGPADVLLVIEIADSSLSHDRDVKAPLYAANGIPELWIVDLSNERLAVYRDPGPNGYRQILLPDAGQTIAPKRLPKVKIGVEELWGDSSR
jgi:Uma2 family endonuclease